MTLTTIKYAQDQKSDFKEYIGLGSIAIDKPDGLSYYYPKEKSGKSWENFLKKDIDSILIYTILKFWWDYTENNLYPEDLPDPYQKKFIENVGKIEKVLFKYFQIDDFPPPLFKYIDFIEGNQSFQKVVSREFVGEEIIKITLESSEIFLINENDELNQLFVPRQDYEQLEDDFKDIISLILQP